MKLAEKLSAHEREPVRAARAASRDYDEGFLFGLVVVIAMRSDWTAWQMVVTFCIATGCGLLSAMLSPALREIGEAVRDLIFGPRR